VLNAFFTRIDICQGHRNRIEKLVDLLRTEAARANLSNGRLRVLNLGCGPADEICRFIRRDELADRCDFTLLDFSSETIDHARSKIEAACRETGRRPGVEFVHQSINDLLKEAVRNGRIAAEPKYELAYCAGLFDYLSDRVCSKLMDLLHDWVVPGGRIVATNVHPGYRTHAILEDLAEWQLILRDQNQMLGLVPQKGGQATAETEPAGVNVFLDVQKPEDMNGFVRDTAQRRISRESLSGV
jgi:extracellular factor (EF) 3-hydroxypalmitic acid methyl ester biosynthesis protein